MSLPFQSFRNSVVATQGFLELPPDRRARFVNLVVGHWKFRNGEEVTVDEISSESGLRLSYSDREYIKLTIDTIRSVLKTNPSALQEIWNFSEIAHDIEEQRDVEKNRYRRTYRIVDGPQELPGFTAEQAD